MTFKLRTPAPTGSEEALQAAICELLDLLVAQRHLMYFAVPNGGKRHRTVAAKLKRTGTKAGVPDLVLLFPQQSGNITLPGVCPRACARTVFWELKKPGHTKKLEGFQLDWQRELIKFGFEHAVITSVWDAQEQLKRFMPLSWRVREHALQSM